MAWRAVAKGSVWTVNVLQPMINLKIAQAYLVAKDARLTTSTWKDAIQVLIEEKDGANQRRWRTVEKDPALRPVFKEIIVDTDAETLIRAARNGMVSTRVFLPRLHNFCVRRRWQPGPPKIYRHVLMSWRRGSCSASRSMTFRF
jgi:hypothetical protein